MITTTQYVILPGLDPLDSVGFLRKRLKCKKNYK